MSHTEVISPAGRAVYEQPLRLPPERQHFKDKDFFFSSAASVWGKSAGGRGCPHPHQHSHPSLPTFITNPIYHILPSYLPSSSTTSSCHFWWIRSCDCIVRPLEHLTLCVCACWLDCFYRQKGRMDEQSTVSCIFCAELQISTFLFCSQWTGYHVAAC